MTDEAQPKEPEAPQPEAPRADPLPTCPYCKKVGVIPSSREINVGHITFAMIFCSDCHMTLNAQLIRVNGPEQSRILRPH